MLLNACLLQAVIVYFESEKLRDKIIASQIFKSTKEIAASLSIASPSASCFACPVASSASSVLQCGWSSSCVMSV